MSELASAPVEVDPREYSLGRKVLKSISRVLGLEEISQTADLPEPAGHWRGNMMYDSDGNILAVRDSNGNVF
jgi:hypothetical protein